MTDDEKAQTNPNAQVAYALAGGFTVANGATVNGVVISHTPTKGEPYTDVTVTIRTLGSVIIG